MAAGLEDDEPMGERVDLERIGELAALARAVEQIGAYNGAKVLRAALDRELVRWAVDHRPPDLEVAGRLVDLAADLRAAGDPTALADVLQRIAPTVAQRGVVTLEDAPEARTCRVCGELFLGEPPATCPTCEAPAPTFREQPPTWFFDPIEPALALDELAAGPARLEAAVDGVDAEALERQPRPGEWSARETLEHIVGAEELLAARVRRLLAEDEPDLVAWVPASGEAPSDEATPTTGADAAALVARYLELRSATVELLRGIAPADWRRSGRHPEWGRVSVLAQAAYFARHQASHQAQLLAAAEGRVPGERPPAG